MRSCLVGVGVGPGDPELLTLKGVRVLLMAGTVFVPVADLGQPGRAEAVVARHVPVERIRRLPFSLDADPSERDAVWAGAAQEVAGALAEGGTAAFATIGDPNVFSTFAYLAAATRRLLPGLVVETVPGITAMQDLAARTGTILCEGDEVLTLLPFTAGPERFAESLDRSEVVVCYKGGSSLAQVLGVVEASGRLGEAVYGARLGLAGEEVRSALEMTGTGTGPYLSTVIVGPRPGSRRSR